MKNINNFNLPQLSDCETFNMLFFLFTQQIERKVNSLTKEFYSNANGKKPTGSEFCDFHINILDMTKAELQNLKALSKSLKLDEKETNN